MHDEPQTTENRVQAFCLSKGDETIYPSDVAVAVGISWAKAEEIMEDLRARGKLQHDK